jgi:very-long-chain enoyl-CoA reductase
MHLVISYLGAIAAFNAVLMPSMQTAWSEVLHIPWNVLLPVLLWMFHFNRRAAEAAWIHRFGKKTLPWSHAFVPWMYYWGFAAWIAHELASPHSALSSDAFLLPGMALFCCGELGNVHAHLMLRRMRADGMEKRVIPRGFLFEYVSCPHYFFEIVSWTGFAMITGLLSALVFAITGAAIMTVWATQRHRAYLAEFDGREGRERYPQRRKIIIPFVY